MGTPTKILIVDDHPFFRTGVRFFIESLNDFKLMGEAENGEQALQMIGSHKVDVVLMDLDMPGMDGIMTTNELLKINPALGILVLTSFGNEEKIYEAIAAGASGYCLKDTPPDELIAAIKAVAAGGTYLGRGLTSKLLVYTQNLSSSCEDVTPQSEQTSSLFSELTQRERDVLEKLADGLGNKIIAQELYISEKTVKTHISNILQKLGVNTRTQAALLYSKHEINGSDT